MEKGGCVYILTSQRNTVLYTGVTSDLVSRINEHVHRIYKNSFSSKYNLNKLVYYELFLSIEEAIDREKQLKGGSRRKKEELIFQFNPEWKDLYPEILKW